MEMDLLLVNAPAEDIYGILEEARGYRQPLGIGYIAAFVEHRGYSVKIIDCDAEAITSKNFSGILETLKPKVIGFSCTTPLIATIINMVNTVKAFDKEIVVIAGGPHVTALPEETLRSSKIDIIVRGEGELTTEKILECVRDRKDFCEVMGISYKKDNKIIHNSERELIKDIDFFPFPARHLLSMDKYRASDYLEFFGDKLANIMATRGCPFSCSFCGQDIIFKHSVRKRNYKRIVDELEKIQKDFGVNIFLFEDSTFTANPDLVKETCNEIKKRGIKIKWGAMGRVDLVSEELFQLMKLAGCIFIFYGIESGNQDVLDGAHKKITLNQCREAVSIAKKVGIPVNTSFILGLPGENKNTLENTIDFAVELDADYATFSLATPYPGTEFYETACKEGTVLSSWERYRNARYSEPLYIPTGLSLTELKHFHKLAYKKFYLRPSYILKSIFKVRSFSDLIHKIRVAKDILR